MSSIQPGTLDNEELMRYAQLYLDRKETMPLTWQQELLKRLAQAEDKDRIHI